MHSAGLEPHVAQFELALQLEQVWLNLVLSLLICNEKPEGQTTQLPFWLQLVSAIQESPWDKYPWRQEIHEAGLSTKQVAQGGKHYIWHWKFWFKKYP